MRRTSRTQLFAGLAAVAWLIVISVSHYLLSREAHAVQTVRMGYMPVVTNLACPVLDEATRHSDSTRFEGIKFSSFAEMGNAIRSGHIDAAFIIAPLSIVLRQQGADVEVVYIGNRHESTLVVRKDLNVSDFGDLAGRTLAVPMRYSGHYIVARQLQDSFGDRGRDVNVVEMNPPDMPSAMASGALDAYFVGEPFAYASERAGFGRTLYRVEELWPGFVCNLVVVRGDLIRHSPELVAHLVQSAARSGLWARENRDLAARIAATHWNQDVNLVREVFETYANRFVWDRYTPDEDELQHLADEMVRYDLLETGDISGLVNPSFALRANLSDISDLASVVEAPHVPSDP